MNILPIELLQHIVFYLIPNIIQATPAPTSNNNHNFNDIFNVRLVNQALAAAASQPFVDIIQDHSWKLNTTSLNRLSNLLLNVHVAKYTTRLTINTYHFSFDRDYALESDGHFERDVAARAKYIKDKAPSQLAKVFQRAKNLRHLTITLVLQQGDPTSLAKQIWPSNPDHPLHNHTPEQQVIATQIRNPLIALRNAMRDTRLYNRLVSAHISSPGNETEFEIQSHHVAGRLGCPNITRLAMCATYVIGFIAPLHCPRLQVLELLHVERLRAGDFHPDREGAAFLDDRRRVAEMLEVVKSIRVVGGVDAEGKVGCEIDAEILFGLIGFLARYSSELETLDMENLNVAGKLGDDGAEQSALSEEREFGIGTMRLENVRWEHVAKTWAGSWLRRDDPGVVKTVLLRCIVGKIVVGNGA
jgi:hypothetical protein